MFTKYDGEEWIEPITLTPGHNYLAQMVFTTVVDSDPEKLVDGTCVSTDGYSRSLCLVGSISNSDKKNGFILLVCVILK